MEAAALERARAARVTLPRRRSSGIALYVRGAGAILRRDLKLFLSYRTRVITQLFQTITSLTLFYFVSRLVSVPSVGSPDQYFGNVVVGLAVLNAVSATILELPTAVRSELLSGTFERLLVAPVGPVACVLGMSLFPFVSALMLGVVSMLLAAAVFSMSIAWATFWLYVPLGLLCSLAFTPFAILLTAAVIVAKQANSGAGFVLTLISLVSGFFFPVQLLPSWIAWAPDMQPFTPGLELLRHVVNGAPLDASIANLVARVVGFAVVLVPLSAYALHAAIRISRRRGTITEY
jgi:ABC-2 type transport system permease protein